MTLVAIGFFLVQNAEPCYNTFLTRKHMSELQHKFYAALARIQQHTDLDDEDAQDAIAALSQLIEDNVQ
jgi:hypothetical protein